MSGIELTTTLAIVILIGCIGIFQIVSDSRRSANCVMDDLAPMESARDSAMHSIRSGRFRLVLDDVLGKAGLLANEERQTFAMRGKLIPFLGMVVGVMASLVLGTIESSSLLAMSLAGGAIGYLISCGALNRQANRYRKDLEFYLPLVMERLVMAVQSGLDLMVAIGAIISLDKTGKSDPATRLLAIVHKLTEAGLTFEQALNQVAANTECSALRHAFIHLAVAHKEGGELVMPLKELSDSTQLYFQESVEEEIAKLPVKATMPLLLTFAGLIICFVTTPVIQITTLMQKQMEAFH